MKDKVIEKEERAQKVAKLAFCKILEWDAPWIRNQQLMMQLLKKPWKY